MSEEGSAHSELDMSVVLCYFNLPFSNSFFLLVYKQESLELCGVTYTSHQGLTERRNAGIDKLYSRV